MEAVSWEESLSLLLTCGKNDAWARGCCRDETRLDTVTGTCWVLLFCILATGTVGKLADSGKLMVLLISW